MRLDLPSDLYIAVCRKINRDQQHNDFITAREIAKVIQNLLTLYAKDELFELDDLPSELKERVLAYRDYKGSTLRRALKLKLKQDSKHLTKLKLKTLNNNQ
ncbi:hypothetical protein EXA18_00635 [Vibrio cincinnatiensis]|uniref:hypothetical protein n=1 Tax=Vibrio cincinnatiensis TaxID=675 RepID=UPI001EDED9FB|nr:hypothetical protein [Vibrio cincinnatiensis]MCG3741989.1 hypothetical protein [Vibrio cincinnatiensis]